MSMNVDTGETLDKAQKTLQGGCSNFIHMHQGVGTCILHK